MNLRFPSVLVLGALLVGTPASAQWRRGLTDRGLDTLRQVARRDSVDAEAWYRLGLGLWEKQRYDEADTVFRRALTFQPTHAGAHLGLSALPFGRGSRYLFDLPRRISEDSLERFFTGVQRHARDAFLYDPTVDLTPLRFLNDESLVADHAGLQCIGAFCFAMRVDRKWLKPTRRGARHLVTGQADSAYILMRDALDGRKPEEVVPDDFIWYYALAADRSGHPEEAANGYRELAQRETRREPDRQTIGLSPRSRAMYLLLYGMASDRAGSTAVARAALREALLTDLTLFQAHSRLAEIAEMRGETEEAIAERRSAIDIAPDLARLEVDLGITFLQMGRAEEARAAFLSATTRSPRDPVAQLFLFQAAFTLKDRANAEQALVALERYAPMRNRDQVAEARRRLSELP